jgi:4'-phosphopantetheinyl transferase
MHAGFADRIAAWLMMTQTPEHEVKKISLSIEHNPTLRSILRQQRRCRRVADDLLACRLPAAKIPQKKNISSDGNFFRHRFIPCAIMRLSPSLSGSLVMRTDEDAEVVWQSPGVELRLPRHEVHVWRARLDLPQSLAGFLATLAPDEKERAARFHFQKDRNHFIVARGLLRAILSRYLARRPEQLSFSYSAHGKPSLASEHGSDVRFNVSHSHGMALFAFARGRDLGVDLEWVRADVAEEQIAERFFSACEVTALRALPAERQAEAFFNCWTRKEAYIKARGEGLSLPLNQFDVSLAPGEPAALLCTRLEADEVSRWSMTELAPGAGFKAALVVEGRDWRLRRWQWRE